VGLKGVYIAYDSGWANLGTFDTKAAAREAFPNAYNITFNDSGRYLIGRWADVKMSIEELTAKAKSVYIATQTDDYTQKIRDAQRGIDDILLTANQRFGYTSAKSDFSF
jgi:hypothetical protein